VKQCVSLLEDLNENPSLLQSLSENEKLALMKAAGRFSRPNRAELKARNRERVLKNRLSLVMKRKFAALLGSATQEKLLSLLHQKNLNT
jgi:hypothetical protein